MSLYSQNGVNNSYGIGSLVNNPYITTPITSNPNLPLSSDFQSSRMANYGMWNQGAPTTYTADAQTAMGFTPAPEKEQGMFGGVGDWFDKIGITSKDGSIFGVNKAQQKGLGELAGLGSGLWNMYSANRNYGMMKDYYNNQMSLQNEQMQRVRDEDTRVSGMREGLAKNYGGK